MNKRAPYAAVFLISVFALSLQIAAMSVLSITQWSHFAYMIISAALLGFGASGSFLAVFKGKIKDGGNFVYGSLLLCSFFCAAAFAAVWRPVFSFDSYLIFASSAQAAKLFLNYIIFFIPFFFAALVIAYSFTAYAENINKIYFFNLLGSGLGAVFSLALINLVLSEKLFGALALIPLAAALLVMPKKKFVALLFFSAAALPALLIIFLPLKLNVSQYKGVSRALNLEGSEIIQSAPSVYGFLEYARAPRLRYAPGISLSYKGEIPQADRVYLNGNFFGPLYARKEDYEIFDHTVKALPYTLTEIKSALFLNARTFHDAHYASFKGVEKIMAVDALASKTSRMIFAHPPRFEIYNIDPRAYLFKEKEKYDLITLPSIDVFGGASGLFSLSENHIMTKEAFFQIFNSLHPAGVFYISAWLDYPPRAPLRTLAIIAQTLDEMGFSPEEHTAVIRDWAKVHFIVKKNGFSDSCIAEIKKFCGKNMFDIDFLKGPREEKFNYISQKDYFTSVKNIFSPHRREFYDTYKFNLAPPDDNKPYFFNFLKLKHIKELVSGFGLRNFAFTELGHLISTLNFIQVLLAALVLIVFPLFKLKAKLKNKFYAIVYFSSLGLGYMFIEMVLIYKFSLYFGSPVYSAAFVIAAMLIISGLGSLFSARFKPVKKNIFKICAAVSGIIIFYSFFLNHIFYAAVTLPFYLKIPVFFAVVFPLAFLMGMPFPSGLRLIKNKNESLAWCWGINGSLSVIAAASVLLISSLAGFWAVMILAAFFYGTAALINM